MNQQSRKSRLTCLKLKTNLLLHRPTLSFLYYAYVQHHAFYVVMKHMKICGTLIELLSCFYSFSSNLPFLIVNEVLFEEETLLQSCFIFLPYSRLIQNLTKVNMQPGTSTIHGAIAKRFVLSVDSVIANKMKMQK